MVRRSLGEPFSLRQEIGLLRSQTRQLFESFQMGGLGGDCLVQRRSAQTLDAFVEPGAALAGGPTESFAEPQDAVAPPHGGPIAGGRRSHATAGAQTRVERFEPLMVPI